MLSTFSSFVLRVWSSAKAHKVISATLLLIVCGFLWWAFAASRKTVPQTIAVTEGSITETVSVTGNTKPLKSVSLGFERSGTIARVRYAIGDRVNAGDVLAELNTVGLQAALEQAEASYRAALASRNQTSLPEAVTGARNVYQATYTTLDTVLREDVDLFFGDPTAYGPELLINAPMYNYGELSKLRASVRNSMERYRTSLANTSATDSLTLLADAERVATEVSAFLLKLSVAAQERDSSASATQLSALTKARSAIDGALAEISKARDAFRSSSVGATDLADANVAQASAAVSVARANLTGTSIVAPISGVISQMDAKVGQTAVGGVTLVSLLSPNAYEIEAGVPETSIGKVAVGNKVDITFDALLGETFEGTVYYMDPAETITQGVVDYKVKVSLNTSDPRIRSGLTANLDIRTRYKEKVVLLPQYAILENDKGTYVQVMQGKTTVNLPVTLGIQDEQGNVEIVSGVVPGENVLNVGLKK
jgi:multidrug efflux pump subunit AcrA (membrane-fusion protein)